MPVGIEYLKKAVKAGVAFFKQGKTSSEGGFQGREIFDFVDELMLLPDILTNTDKIAEEWADRTPEEIDELTAYAITELGESAGTAKAKVAAVINWVGATLQAQLAFRKEPETEPGL